MANSLSDFKIKLFWIPSPNLWIRPEIIKCKKSFGDISLHLVAETPLPTNQEDKENLMQSSKEILKESGKAMIKSISKVKIPVKKKKKS